MSKSIEERQVLIKQAITSDFFIKSLGLSFILASLLYSKGIIEVTPNLILGITFSGFFFVLSDTFFHLQEKIILSKNSRFRSARLSLYDISRNLLILFSILSLSIGSFIDFTAFIKFLSLESENELATILTLATIGLTILNMSNTYTKAQDNLIKEVISDLDSIEKKLDTLYEESIK